MGKEKIIKIREEIVNKYSVLPKDKYDKARSEKEIYLDYINVLNELLLEIKQLKKERMVFMLNGFLPRQLGCIERITKEDIGWRTNLEKFHQRYYELMDFIFSIGCEYTSFAQEEFSIIELMINYLITLANENIK